MSIGLLILLSLAVGVGAWLLFMWSVKSGQYEDPEGPKYRMLEDDDEGMPRGKGKGEGTGTGTGRGHGPGDTGNGSGDGKGTGIGDRARGHGRRDTGTIER